MKDRFQPVTCVPNLIGYHGPRIEAACCSIGK